jgi:molybdate transport system permease protein
MGLGESRVLAQITLPLALRGISVGLTLGFLRALGEFGATFMIGGAIYGRTWTMPIAITNAQSPEQFSAIMTVLVVLAFLALGLIGLLERGGEIDS